MLSLQVRGKVHSFTRPRRLPVAAIAMCCVMMTPFLLVHAGAQSTQADLAVSIWSIRSVQESISNAAKRGESVVVARVPSVDPRNLNPTPRAELTVITRIIGPLVNGPIEVQNENVSRRVRLLPMRTGQTWILTYSGKSGSVDRTTATQVSDGDELLSLVTRHASWVNTSRSPNLTQEMRAAVLDRTASDLSRFAALYSWLLKSSDGALVPVEPEFSAIRKCMLHLLDENELSQEVRAQVAQLLFVAPAPSIAADSDEARALNLLINLTKTEPDLLVANAAISRLENFALRSTISHEGKTRQLYYPEVVAAIRERAGHDLTLPKERRTRASATLQALEFSGCASLDSSAGSNQLVSRVPASP